MLTVLFSTQDHLAATPIGMDVTAESILLKQDKRALTFEVVVRDEVEVIGKGTHSRAIVPIEKFRGFGTRRLEKVIALINSLQSNEYKIKQRSNEFRSPTISKRLRFSKNQTSCDPKNFQSLRFLFVPEGLAESLLLPSRLSSKALTKS